MVTTFKVGDKVRALTDCVFGNDRVYKGTEYTITSVDLGFGYVGVNNRSGAHPASEFELVPELPYITFYQSYKVGDRVNYAGEVVSVIDTEADNLWPIRIKYDTGVEGLVSTSELDYWGGKVKYVDPFPEGTRVYVKPGGSNIGDKNGLYVGGGTVEKHWDKITEKTHDRAVRFDSAGVRIYCHLTHIVPIEDAPKPERKDWTELVDRAYVVADTVGFVLGEENNVSALIDELIAALTEESYR